MTDTTTTTNPYQFLIDQPDAEEVTPDFLLINDEGDRYWRIAGVQKMARHWAEQRLLFQVLVAREINGRKFDRIEDLTRDLVPGDQVIINRADPEKVEYGTIKQIGNSRDPKAIVFEERIKAANWWQVYLLPKQ